MSGFQDQGLTPQQEQCVIALLNEPTIAKAAVAAGVTDRTVYRWMDEPAFSRVYRKARREGFSQAIGMAQKYAPHAVQTLMKMIADTATPAAVRATCCAMLLKFSRDSIELDDMQARLEALEASQPEKEKKGW